MSWLVSRYLVILLIKRTNLSQLHLLVSCINKQNYDVYFVIDGSLSVTPTNFRRVKNFLKSFISYMQIGAGKNHIGLIQFSEEHLTGIEYSIDDVQKKGVILKKLLDMQYQAGRYTLTGQALKIILDSVGNTSHTWKLLKCFTLFLCDNTIPTRF